jgi:mannose-1-phosphate guanylyltransferase
MYAVILAGGGGTRLWPLSDPRHPKPFLPLFADGSLLAKTISRLTGGSELGLTADAITVVTDQRYGGLVRDETNVAVLSEPIGRNTAAAVALAALAIERDLDEVMIVLPADHLVKREAIFREVISNAHHELAQGAFGIDSPLVTLGIQADSAATQYGYLVPDKTRHKEEKLHSYVLEAFVEKPDPDKARQLIDLGGAAWNAGIFLARRRAWLAALERHTTLIPMLRGAISAPDQLAAAYAEINPVSIDYAVMQAAAAERQVVMGAMDVGWSDVGTWTALLDALVDGYAAPARVVPPGEGATLGEDDLAVIRSANDVLRLEPGPIELGSQQPLAWLPDARQHRAALEALIARVNDRMAATAEARA